MQHKTSINFKLAVGVYRLYLKWLLDLTKREFDQDKRNGLTLRHDSSHSASKFERVQRNFSQIWDKLWPLAWATTIKLAAQFRLRSERSLRKWVSSQYHDYDIGARLSFNDQGLGAIGKAFLNSSLDFASNSPKKQRGDFNGHFRISQNSEYRPAPILAQDYARDATAARARPGSRVWLSKSCGDRVRALVEHASLRDPLHGS